MGKWEMVRLGDVCEILDSQRIPVTASERKTGNYPYFGANGVQGYVSDYIFDDELVLLAEDGGNFGSKTRPIAYRVSGKCWVNNHAHVLRAKQCLDTDYLCKSIMFYDVSKLISGTTRAKLNQAAMRKMLLPLPPLDEQKRIAKNLDLASEIVKGYKEQIAELDKLVQTVFYEMFGDPVTNEKGWAQERLGKVCFKITDGKHGGCEIKEDSGYYFVGAREIYDGKINYRTAPQITKEHFEESYSRCNIENGDLVLVNTGATIGKSAIVNDVFTTRTLLQKSVALYKANTSLILPIYLKWCYALNPEMHKVKSASAQPNLLLSKIRETEVILPPLSLQTRFAAIVTEIEAQKAQVQQALTEAENLFNSLMQEYFE